MFIMLAAVPKVGNMKAEKDFLQLETKESSFFFYCRVLLLVCAWLWQCNKLYSELKLDST